MPGRAAVARGELHARKHGCSKSLLRCEIHIGTREKAFEVQRVATTTNIAGDAS